MGYSIYSSIDFLSCVITMQKQEATYVTPVYGLLLACSYLVAM